MRMVSIEFTQDTKDEYGEIKRYVGQRVRVDPESAKSFVEVKKVAKLVGNSAERAKAKTAVKAASKPVEGDD